MVVLLVEDDSGHAELIREAFEETTPDHPVVWARTLAAATEALATGRPDVVIADVHLPDGSCIELLASPALAGCPVVVLTAQGDQAGAVEAMKAGALDYLTKSPATFEALPKIALAAARQGGAMIRLEQAEARLRHANRLIGAGHLAAVTAHEVGTPLNVIRMGAQSLLRTSSEEATRRTALQLVAQVDLIAARLRGMLDYSRAPTPRRGIVPLTQTVRRAIALVAPMVRRVDGEVDLAGDEVLVQADPEQIHQVVFNLVTNALHAGARHIAVEITVQGSTAVLCVSDDGPGVAPEVAERLFEPFTTTKEAGFGTGLGLAVCTEIATRHGGTLALVPSDAGARFELRLPVVT